MSDNVGNSEDIKTQKINFINETFSVIKDNFVKSNFESNLNLKDHKINEQLEEQIDIEIDNYKNSIISLPCEKVEDNFLIPKIIIAYDEIHKKLFKEISIRLNILSTEITQLNEENQKILQNSKENTSQTLYLKTEFKNLKIESKKLINLIKEKLTLQKKLRSSNEEENITKSKFDLEISNLTEKLDIEIKNNKSSMEYNIMDKEKFLLPKEHYLNSLKNEILDFQTKKDTHFNYPKEITPSLHIESQKHAEILHKESINRLKSLQSLVEDKNFQFEESLKQFEESEKKDISKMNTTVEVRGSLEILKGLDEEKIAKEKELEYKKKEIKELQYENHKLKEEFIISDRKYFRSQCVQIFILSIILAALILIYFYKFN